MGLQLDTLYKDQLDKLMAVFRTVSRDEELDLVSRVQILHIIELRAAGWAANDNMVNYYKQKMSHIDTVSQAQDKMRDSPQVNQQYHLQASHPTPTVSQIHTAPISLNANAPDFTPSVAGGGASLLVPGEVVGSSGKFSQPTKIPGKNYFKVRRLPTRELVATSISVSQDEVVIRNADSGKVMGLKGRRVHMIEQLTETVVSFQRLVVSQQEQRHGDCCQGGARGQGEARADHRTRL